MMKNVYSVGQVNTYIKNMFAQDFMLQRINIKGEVSNCKYHTSGHIYFTLKDEAGTINAIMFAGNRRGLAFPMKEGDKVIATGSIEVYERDGKYQLYAREIKKDGEGNLYQKFEALKRELEEMGMFAKEYKQAIPKYAHRIGIVTAPTGAAIQDIRNIASRRNPYAELILYPALVQGDGAIASIVNGIHALDKIGVDVMIIGRGGGSIEDLWAFNDENVARAIFECQTPVISAVGHETDFTISDFVADLRAPTPSAAAELAVFEYTAVKEQLSQTGSRMQWLLKQKIAAERMRLKQCQTKLQYLSPAAQLREKQKYAADLEEKLNGFFQQRIMEKRHRLALICGQLEAMSPAKKLSQGYSYVSDTSGKAITDAAKVQVSEELLVQLYKGSLKATVTEVTYHE